MEEIKNSGTYKVVVIKDNVLFPRQLLTITLNSDKAKQAMELADANNEYVLVVAQKDSKTVNPSDNEIYKVGTLAKYQISGKLQTGTAKVIVQGIKRMKIEEFTAFSPYIECNATDYGEECSAENVSVQALVNLIEDEFAKLAKLSPKKQPPRLEKNDPIKTVSLLAYEIFESTQGRQQMLELNSTIDQLEVIYNKVLSATDILEAEKSIAKRVRESVDQNQKEFYLREQIKAIHDELGDDEKEKEQYIKLSKDKGLPEYAIKKLEKEMLRLDKMAPNSPEAGVVRTYIEWLLDLPWSVCTEDSVDLEQAMKVLDEDHYGLEKIKERIIEYLAVHTLTKNLSGAILCFVGPPGVGKTSIVSSIARASNRKLVQMSLGGVRDEAEIRGHRRTYVGSMPGRILAGMKNAGVNNPVFLLDEIDKMSSDFRGDPASAMLEVLDPNQNNAFIDHYLEIPYDLSQTMFVATANSIESIPSPLLDRMEVIFLSGYTYNEKLEIAKRYLIPKQKAKNGMEHANITISDDVLMEVVTSYTRENGVRNLERQIAKLIRKLAVEKINKNVDEFDVKLEDLEKYLGAPTKKDFDKVAQSKVGVVKGLAWTSVGGVTLDVECALFGGGKGEITLTGSMGDVMKESARISLSVIKARAQEYGIDYATFKENDVHIHIPEGATPKDGPSAGVTLSTALLSAFTGRKVRGDVAMTGEVTLTGRVLAIGGLKEKSLAGYMSGIKTLIIPKENEKDIRDIPNEVKENVEIVTVSTVEEVFDIALEK